MRTILDALNELAETTSNNDKIDLLKKADSEFKHLREILIATYHPTWIYGIKKFDLPIATGDMTIEEDWYAVDDMLKDLRDRIVTGKKALKLLDDTLALFTDASQKVIEKIILRDLKCGFSASTINKAIPKLIGTFDVALAYDIKKLSPENLKKTLILDGKTFMGSRKLDGLRCVIVKTGLDIEFFSRTGKPFLTLDKIKEAVLHTFEGMDVVLDGEACIVDEYGMEDFYKITTEYSKKNHTIENPKYFIFDILDHDHFFAKTDEPSRIFSERIERVKSIVESKQHPMLEVLEQTFLTEEIYESIKAQSLEGGWEGVMLRQDIPYVSGRKKSLLKYKLFHESEFEVLDVIIDDFTTKVKGKGQVTFKDVVKSLVIEHKGIRVGVGSGLKIQQRIDWAEDPSLIIGNEITVKYFEPTKNQQGTESLRFPTLKAVHDGKRDV